MTQIIPNPVELRRRGFEVLVEALGWVNAVRFIQEYETDTTDYVLNRERLLPSWDAETLVHRMQQIEQSRNSQPQDDAN